MSPATQIVVAAGWLGTRRAIQATREGVTDLRNRRLKLTFRQFSLTRCTGTRMVAGKDLHSQGIPIAPVGDRLMHSLVVRTLPSIYILSQYSSPKLGHFGFVSASEFFLLALVALEWVKSEGKSLFVCHPAEEGEYGGAVGDLSRCNGGKEDARVVLESKGES